MELKSLPPLVARTSPLMPDPSSIAVADLHSIAQNVHELVLLGWYILFAIILTWLLR